MEIYGIIDIIIIFISKLQIEFNTQHVQLNQFISYIIYSILLRSIIENSSYLRNLIHIPK